MNVARRPLTLVTFSSLIKQKQICRVIPINKRGIGFVPLDFNAFDKKVADCWINEMGALLWKVFPHLLYNKDRIAMS